MLLKNLMIGASLFFMKTMGGFPMNGFTYFSKSEITDSKTNIFVVPNDDPM